MAPNAILRVSLALFAALHLVSADVEFTSPAANGPGLSAGSVSVAWKDSGDEPPISALTTYQLFLCAGGNSEDEYDVLLALTPTIPSTFAITGNKFTGTVGATVGGPSKNAYFFKMISTAAAGGTVTNFSPRFAMSGMTGTFSAKVTTGLKSVTGTDGPDTINAVADAQNPAANPSAGDYDVEYTMQTGATRYAPMQPVPPTKITKKNRTPLYPTSSVDIAKSHLPIPKQQTTITQSQTFSVSSMENTVSAAPMPSDDMAKFLARWKD
ncbi:beta-1,6-glucan boisynthesis protein-like protein [Lophiotrema nucula]|uniref:Beta-1,6-glucan boisynthesis protein-like protein n=1 Tax=Lophiotrema nucula TaxID=690887 RepID=A0A6A5Z369_9PLEO|nr:beta-1,6-glucan boisynthesis protein-like protein [Lophiotrema nucula]